MTMEELVQRLIELHEELEERAEDAFVWDKVEIQKVCEDVAFRLKNIIDDII